MHGKSNMETYITICKIDSQRIFTVWLSLEGRLSGHGLRVYLSCGMWNLPRLGIKPLSSVLTGDSFF